MTENYLRACIKCGGKTIKQDTCSACRKRAAHQPREFQETRSMVNEKVDAILAESPLNAKKRAQELFSKISDINTPKRELEKLWHEYRQAKAIVNREVITENTLI